MLKHFLLLLMCLTGCTLLQAQTSSLEINKCSGESETVPLLEIDKITFSEGNLILTLKSEGKGLVKTSEIRNLTFSQPTGLQDQSLLSGKPEIASYPVREYIYLKNVTDEKLHIAIYSVEGTSFLNQTEANPQQPIDVRQLPSGVYLLQVNQYTIKFMKQ